MLQAGLLKEYVARPAKCACLQGKGGTAGERRPQRPREPTWLLIGWVRATGRDESSLRSAMFLCSVALKHTASSAEVGPGICAPQPLLGDRCSTSTTAMHKTQYHSMLKHIARVDIRSPGAGSRDRRSTALIGPRREPVSHRAKVRRWSSV